MGMSARRMLRWLLALQAVGAAGIALACRYWFGMSPWAACALGLACVVLVRLVINMNNFVLSACFASPTPREYRIRPGARLRLLAEEFRSSMLHSSWFMPRAAPCRRIHPSVDPDLRAVPVLLVHGYGCNSGYWTYLMPRLDRERISYASIDLEPVGGAIDDYVPALEHAVSELCAATGAAQVAIVAHSMGGLVARAWMRAHGSARVARVITLGTPHHGTRLAHFGPGANAVQMRRSSDWLRALGDSEDGARRALVTSIFSHHDNIVAPQTSSVLEGARNIALGGVGHVALGCNARVLDTVMAELATLAPHPKAAPVLLLVDDDPFMLDLLHDTVDGQGWRVLTADSGEAALAILAREHVAVIVSDHLMPGMSGAELLARARRLAPASFRILLSGAGQDAALRAALDGGDADACQSKPWRADALLALLREAFAARCTGAV
jgi:CheY-like chemotaxis protein